jgi:DNA topoisomerase-1
MLDIEADLSVEVAVSAPPPGLRYVSDAGRGVRRRRAGKGFVYFDAKGARIADPAVLRRIRALVIPPAWTHVWICPSPHGHIQATGRDAKGRKQCRYHADYREAREEAKFEHMVEFASALPAIRATVAEHMSLKGLPRRKVLATIVHLLEATLIRVGNDEYAKANQSFGLTTLRSDHIEVNGSEIRFAFAGKSGKKWTVAMRDRRVAKILRACQDLPGQELLQYFDEDRELRGVSSGDVNDYLREIAGYDVTAKDFRTWAGTVLMTRSLSEAGAAESERQAKKLMRGALVRVAAALGNTPTVCRKSYIHPSVTAAWLERRFKPEAATLDLPGMRPEEVAVLAMLRTLKDSPAAPAEKTSSRRYGGDPANRPLAPFSPAGIGSARIR